MCLYFANGIPCKQRKDLELPEIELIWAELFLKHRPHRPLLVGCCYRPPSSTAVFYTHLESVLHSVVDRDLILVGDFNAKHRQLYNEDLTDNNGMKLKDMMDGFAMDQL